MPPRGRGARRKPTKKRGETAASDVVASSAADLLPSEDKEVEAAQVFVMSIRTQTFLQALYAEEVERAHVCYSARTNQMKAGDNNKVRYVRKSGVALLAST